LAETLNEFHGLNHSLRYWRILIGWWLFQFIQLVLDRSEVLRTASEEFPGARLVRINSTDEPPAGVDNYDFWSSITLDEWNERFFGVIAEKMGIFSIARAMSGDRAKAREALSSGSAVKNDSVFWRIPGLSRAVSKFLHWRARLSCLGRVHFSADFIRPLEKLKLLLLLGQLPMRQQSQGRRPQVLPEFSARQWTLEMGQAHPLGGFLAELIPLYLPASFLEGFEAWREHAEREYQNCNPEVIVTGNSHFANDSWGFFAANRIEKGAKLVILQHGGTYGVTAFSTAQDYEVSVSDRFLSWGWTDPETTSVVPAPAGKLLGSRLLRSRRKEQLLYVMGGFSQQPDFIGSWPIGAGIESYFDDQFRLVRSLSLDIREDLVVRTYPEDYGWDQIGRWAVEDPAIKLQLKTPFRKSLGTSRLVVATYNATTFLQTFRMNIPTVIFWDPQYSELSEGSRAYFDSLREARVFFTNPEECAMHVNKIWDDVDGWWVSDEVGEAVGRFCERFAYAGVKPLREFRDALLKW
jgi:putative transferase (TIGR04331 family)